MESNCINTRLKLIVVYILSTRLYPPAFPAFFFTLAGVYSSFVASGCTVYSITVRLTYSQN